jgi:tuftelin-interacting protein 11
VLHAWLTQPGGANFDEVTRWYLGWKAAVPQSLLDHERVRAQFNAALNAMNSVLEVRGEGRGWEARMSLW